jgi:hypothetical protein
MVHTRKREGRHAHRREASQWFQPEHGTSATNRRDRPASSRKIAADQPGAQPWLRLYGERLVCVRYRDGADGEQRLVTVKLVVDRRPRTASSKEHVAAHTGRDEVKLRQRAKAAGAQFDWNRRVWLLPRAAVAMLGLQRRGWSGRARIGHQRWKDMDTSVDSSTGATPSN